MPILRRSTPYSARTPRWHGLSRAIPGGASRGRWTRRSSRSEPFWGHRFRLLRRIRGADLAFEVGAALVGRVDGVEEGVVGAPGGFQGGARGNGPGVSLD